MGTKVNSNYEDLITFTRASKGHALRPVSYGDELVNSGTFDDASALDDWTATNANLSINNQRLEVENSGSSQGTARQSITTEIGKVYEASFDVVKVSGEGNPIVRLGVSNGGAEYYSTAHSSDATISFIFTPTTTTTFWTLYTGSSTSGFSAIFDNISVKEVLFDQPDGTLTLFEHPDGVPRVEYDADGNRLGLLVEEQRVNLALNSNDLAADWSEQATTATLTQDAVGPDGKISAWTLVDDNSGGTANTVGINEIWTFASGGTYAISIFAKADGLNWIYFSNVLFDGGTDLNYFDLENVALGASNPNTCFIEDVGNGWRRCTQVMTTTTDLSGQIVIRVANSDGDITVDLDGTSSVQLYGFQVEAGSFPTSYMKNEGTASGAIRSADVASIPVADFGYNQSAGTVVAEVVDYTSKPTGSNYVVSLDDNTASNRNQIIRYNNAWIYDVKVSNVTQVSQNLGTTNDPAKVAFAFKLNDFAATEDGDAVVTDTSGTVPNVTKMTIGSAYNNSAQLNGHIKSIKYYPRRLTNAQLQDLTS